MLTDQKTCDISIIIPTLNEERCLAATLTAAQSASGTECIVVDGGSTDNTPAIASRYGARLLVSAAGRARQMNTGAQSARGKILLFLHADTLLPSTFADDIGRTLSGPGVVAGAFRLSIMAEGRGVRLIERCANLRASYGQLPYGDQALFMPAARFRAAGGYPDVPLLEDLMLIRTLRRQGRLALARQAVRTSGRRWHELGLWQTTLRNQLILLAFSLGVSPGRLAGWYYRPRKQG